MDHEQEEITRLIKLYPLHYYVFNNDVEALKSSLLSSSTTDLRDKINMYDIHGRTPVMLATILGHIECAEILLDSGADANIQNKEMWSLSHEAILLKNANYFKKVLTLRDCQRSVHSAQILRELNESLKNSPDFYVEMTWEFTSWLPFVKNLCPSDTYKVKWFMIYKHGNNIRIDANMLEMTANGQQNGTGSQSFIFRFIDNNIAEIIFIDRNENIAYLQNLDLTYDNEPKIEEFVPSDAVVAEKLDSPISTSYIDVDKVGFERSQKSSGLLSWIGTSDKEEEVEGYTCRVYNASNVVISTKTCFDHLTDAQKEEAAKESSNKTMSMLMSLLEKKRIDVPNRTNGDDVYNGLTVIDYLTRPSDSLKPNIGKPREEHVKMNSFNANLWVSESFPLNLREQIFPIIDLLAIKNARFNRLKNFIEMQMPNGFPIRIKIPIFHMINAQITFRNVNEPNDQYIDHSVADDSDLPVFALNEALFQIPEGFEIHGMAAGSFLSNRNDQVEHGQSMRFNTLDVEDGGEYVYLLERFIGDQTPQTSTYEQQLQLAIEESLTSQNNPSMSEITMTASNQTPNQQEGQEMDAELLKALELSQQEEERRQMEMEEEEEQLRAILERSMLDQ